MKNNSSKNAPPSLFAQTLLSFLIHDQILRLICFVDVEVKKRLRLINASYLLNRRRGRL